MILPDHEIAKLCEQGMVTPYHPANVQPASIDVALGDEFRAFDTHEVEVIDLDAPVDITRHVKSSEFVLHPGEFVLGVTVEHVRIPNDIVSRIEGKSSIGRLGLAIHVTAGFIDPGFHGNVTLEMVNLSPVAIKLRPGKRVAQLSFQQMLSAASKPYEGRYQGDTTVTASRYTDTKRADSRGTYVCPNGHRVRPASGPSCMVGSGYYWCGRCVSVPGGISMAGGPMMGMYYPPSRLKPAP